jgi:hypothetical protein
MVAIQVESMKLIVRGYESFLSVAADFAALYCLKKYLFAVANARCAFAIRGTRALFLRESLG